MANFIAATAFDTVNFIGSGSLGELFNFGVVVGATADTFALDYIDEVKAENLTLTGTFADYVDGFPTSGTIANAAYSLNGSLLFNISDLSMPVEQFTAFVQADDISGLFESLLSGADQVAGSAAGDVLLGYGGNDTIDGANGDDVLDGGDGDDVIDGGAGQDQAVGGAGDDTLVVSAAPVAGEVFDGGEGIDTLRFMSSAGAITNTINGPMARGSLIGTTLSSIERLEFGSTAENGLGINILFNQVGAGLSPTAELVGGEGLDQLTIVALGGGTYTAPSFTYSNWNGSTDALVAGDIVVLVASGSADFTLNAAVGHAGAQALFGGTGNDTLNGTSGTELLSGGGGVNILNGAAGDDVLMAVNSAPFQGTTSFYTFAGSQFNGGDDFDFLSVGGFVDFQGTLSSIEGIHFQPAFTGTVPGTNVQESAELVIGASTLAALPTTMTLKGVGTISINLEGGNYDASQWDHIVGSQVFAEFFGNDASQTMIGSTGNDRFSGGFGSDVFTGGLGSDQFEAGDGQHVVTDFTVGTDRVDLQDMNFTSFEQLLPYLSQVGADVVFSRLLGGVEQTMTLRNVTLGSLTAASFVFQTGNDDDTRIGTDFADELFGAYGNDVLEGGADDDYLFSGDGDDTLRGGLGNDRLYAGAGNDFLSEASGDNGPFGDDLYDGGEGTDRVSLFTAFGPGVTVDLRVTTAQNTGSMGTDTFVGIEHITSNHGDDTLIGNDADNWFWTFSGTDNLSGNGGNDYFTVGKGDKIVDGGTGNDTIDIFDTAFVPGYTAAGITVSLAQQGVVQATEAGNWTLTSIENLGGSFGADRLTGDANANILAGGEGDDTLVGGAGDDILSGDGTFDINLNAAPAFFDNPTAADWVFGNDVLEGGDGNDTLNGGDGDDTLRGGLGNDLLRGGAGNDFLSEASGNDGPFGDDLYDGGEGNDRVSLFNDFGPGVTVDLRIQTAQNTGSMGTDTFVGIEHITSNYGDDTLTGNDAANWFWTFMGNDILSGNGGNDYFTVGTGTKIADGGTGSDTIEISDTAFVPLYGAGGITVSLGLQGSAQATGVGNWTLTNMENLGGSWGADRLTGDANANILAGAEGDDTLLGGDGDDTLAGDGTFALDNVEAPTFIANPDWVGGNDVLEGGAGNDTIYGAGGDDVLRGGIGNDQLHGGDGNDILSESSGANGPFGDDLYEGGAGSDRVSLYSDFGPGVTVDLRIQTAQNTGSRGTDTFVGIEHITSNYGSDTLIGNDEANWFSTFSGTDNLSGNGGNDYFTVGSGNKIADGGDGVDTIEIAEFAFEPVYTAEGFTVSLALQGTAQDTGAGTWTITNMENLGGFTGSDELTGDGNANVLAGHIGDDTLTGADGNDVLAGDGTWVFENGAQQFVENHTADGPGGNDILSGGAGDDRLIGGGGNDAIDGGEGDDLIDGGEGADSMTGGAGNDVYLIDQAGGPDQAGDSVNEAADGGTDEIRTTIHWGLSGTNVENITALGTGNIFLGGSDVANVLTGNIGDNYIVGEGGNDQIDGGLGRDVASFSVPAGTSGTFVLVDGTGADAGKLLVQLVDGETVQTVARVTLNGGGSATIEGVGLGASWGTDTVENIEELHFLEQTTDGSNATNLIVVNMAVGQFGDFVSGSEKDDVIDFATYAGAVNANGNRGDDAITGNDAGNNLSGGLGNDLLRGLNGADHLDGNEGNDTLEGGADDDYLIGGAGSDLIDGGTGTNDITSFQLPEGTPGTITVVDGSGDDAGKLLVQITDGGVTQTFLRVTVTGLGAAIVEGVGIGAFMGTDTVSNVDQLHIFVNSPGGALPGQFVPIYLTTVQLGTFVAGSERADTIDLADFAGAINANGNRGDDAITGTDVDNSLQGGAGNDTLSGEAGSDFLNGQAGNDTLSGGLDNDTLIGAAGGDTLSGGDGDDTLIGAFNNGFGPQPGDGADILRGEGGNDLIRGGDGDDLLEGGDGNDNLRGDSGSDILDGGAGEDLASLQFSALASGITFDGRTIGATDTSTITDPLGGTDTLISIEKINIGGTNFDDIIYGSEHFAPTAAYANQLYGNGGNDQLFGASAQDYLEGGDGNDMLEAGDGDDTLVAGAGDDVLDGGEGSSDEAVFLVEGDASATLSIIDGTGAYAGGKLIVLTTGDHTETVAAITSAGGEIIVTGLGSAAALGTDTLVNVERIVFETATSSVTMTTGEGIVVDGLVAGATVFMDADEDGVWDQGEARTTTGADGTFVFVSPGAGPIVATGGINADTGLPNQMTLTAPGGGSVVNPLTTLIQAVISASAVPLTAAAAATQVAGALGISSSIDLLNTNVFALAASGDASALAAQKAAAIIVSIIVAAEDAASTPGAGALVMDGLASIVSEATGDVSLTDQATIAQALGSALSADDVDAIAGTLATSAQAIADADDLASVSDAQAAALTTGNDLDNAITGGAGNDQLIGLGGADTLVGGGGSDVLDGGDGMDTAIYSGLFRSYDVVRNAASGTVAGGAEGGTDTLTSIEFIQFQDGKFVFDTDGVAAQVTRLYDTVLQRGPDQVGLDYWVDQLQDFGGTLKQISTGFLNSSEFQDKTGQLSDADYVDFLYLNALGRASDVDGKNYWVGQLQSSAMDRADLLIGFSESGEHRDLTAELVGKGFFETDDDYQTVALLYDTFAGRRPDAEGLIYWAEALENGTFTLDRVADGFADSVEFRTLTANMSNAELVNFMYQNTLDRASDPDGLNYWVGQLEAGMDRGGLLLGFSQSYEHFNLLGAEVTYGIDYL